MKDKKRRQTISLRIDRDLKEFLAEVAESAGVDVSTVATCVLCLYVVRLKRDVGSKHDAAT
jgi:antitoxin component of RelBE/YafQ-DinJ toxin-antitoxin module